MQNDVDVAALGKQQYAQMKQLQKVNEAKALKTGDAPERITADQYNRMPLRAAVLGKKYVACHRVYGHLFLDPQSALQEGDAQ